MRADDLTIPQGTTWEVSWPITNADGDPQNLAGYTAKAQVRESVAATDVLHEWSTDADTITLSGSTLTLTVTPAVSSAWEWREGVYDVELTSPTGQVTRITKGHAIVDPEVTR